MTTTETAVDLREGIAALGLALDARQEMQLADYLALLAKWNKTYNLTAIRDPARMITHHVLDSLAVLAHLPAAPSLRLLDVGSGGGLPGLVIARRRPDLSLVLVERRTTRADLLRRAVSRLDLGERVRVHGADVEALAHHAPHAFDAVTARSFAAPSVTLRWAGELLAPGGVLLVSEPPADDPDRWPSSLVVAAGLVDDGRQQGIRRFHRS